jgi:hypothetical protein
MAGITSLLTLGLIRNFHSAGFRLRSGRPSIIAQIIDCFGGVLSPDEASPTKRGRSNADVAATPQAA